MIEAYFLEDYFMRQAILNDDLKLATIMWDFDIEPISPDKYYRGRPPLAIFLGNERIARLLIERGLDVNEYCKTCDNPLYHAAGKGLREVLEVMLQHGADPTI